MLDNLVKDLRYGARTLRRSPAFELVVVVTLALGIGAYTAIFSVVDGILLRPLSLPEPDRLVAFWADYTRINGREREWLSYPDFHDARQLEVFEEVAVYGGWGPTITGHGGAAEQISGSLVSYGMLSKVLRVEPQIGRGFVAEDDMPGAEATVLLSHRLWQRSFGGDTHVVGQSVILNMQPYAVVGVMPADFRPPFAPLADLWAPGQQDLETGFPRGNASYRAIARLADDVDLTTASAALDALALRLEAEFPRTNTNMGFVIYPLLEDIVNTASLALWVLLGAVGFVLLISCVNVANLMLAQASSRESELALRTALGANRGRVLRQLLSESLLLALLGGGLGALLGIAGTRLLVALAPAGTPRIEDVQIDARVLLFTLAVSVASAFVFGLLPALRLTRADLHDVLKDGGRGGDAGARGRSLRGFLVVLQVAVALVLLVGAGLFLRTFQQLNAVDLGFHPEGLLTLNLNLPGAQYGEPADRIAFYDELERRVGGLPGVISVGATSTLPMSGNDTDATFHVENQPRRQAGESQAAWVRPVTPNYFEAVGLRIDAGRGFDERDGADGERVIVINQTLARQYFPEEDPIGKRVTFGDPDEANWRSIIGIARDVKNFGIAADSRSAIYFPYAQVPWGFMAVAVRTNGDPSSLAEPVRRVVGELDGNLAVSSIATMESVVSESLAPQRFVATLMTTFAAIALLLAVVGLYGVVSYGVSLRQREMGVRLALGASGRDIRRLVVGGSMALVTIGIVLGLVGAFAVTRLFESLLRSWSLLNNPIDLRSEPRCEQPT